KQLDGAGRGERGGEVGREVGGAEGVGEQADRGARTGAGGRAGPRLGADEEKAAGEALDAGGGGDVGAERAGREGRVRGRARREVPVGGGVPAGQGGACGGLGGAPRADGVDERTRDARLLRADEEQPRAQGAQREEHEQGEQQSEPAVARARGATDVWAGPAAEAGPDRGARRAHGTPPCAAPFSSARRSRAS